MKICSLVDIGALSMDAVSELVNSWIDFFTLNLKSLDLAIYASSSSLIPYHVPNNNYLITNHLSFGIKLNIVFYSSLKLSESTMQKP